MKRITDFIKNTKISYLDAFSSITPTVIIVTWAFVVDKVFKNQVSQAFTTFVIFVCVFIAGAGGLFQVIKKEAPWVGDRTIKGNLAVASGIFRMILFFGAGVLILYFYMSGWTLDLP